MNNIQEKINKISINGQDYILASNVQQKAENLDWMEYVIVRTYSAWVFAWYLKERNWKEVILKNVTRLWYWSWACSLSQLAVDWTTKPNDCKFAVDVDTLILTEAIEIIPVTEKARLSINSVKKWKQ